MLVVPAKIPEESDGAGQLPFVCPACAAPNTVSLVALSRADATRCVACARTLRVRDVMRARQSPRR